MRSVVPEQKRVPWIFRQKPDGRTGKYAVADGWDWGVPAPEGWKKVEGHHGPGGVLNSSWVASLNKQHDFERHRVEGSCTVVSRKEGGRGDQRDSVSTRKGMSRGARPWDANFERRSVEVGGSAKKSQGNWDVLNGSSE